MDHLAKQQVHVKIGNEQKEMAAGTCYTDMFPPVSSSLGDRVLLVEEKDRDGIARLRELHHQVKDGAEITPLTIQSDAGYKAYVRSMAMLLHCAAEKILGNRTEVCVHFVVSGGLFCTLTDPVCLTNSFLEEVTDEMHRLVGAQVPIRKRALPTGEAADLFAAEGMADKERLLHYRRASRTNVYSMEDYADYHYGYMVHDTSCLRLFDLKMYAEGFVLRYADRSNPDVLPPFRPNEKLFNVQNTSRHWGETMQVKTVADLNDRIVSGSAKDLILVMEAFQEKQIAAIAEKIAADPAKKIIMIAGPSSSGKTTFSHRLSAQLSVYGLKPHPVPVDDYFKNREDTPKNPDGSYNFECLEAIDTEQFNTDMCALLAGEQVELPVFNFKTGKREYKGKTLQLGSNDILVIEGIHGLNDAMSYKLPQESKFKIYISALTQLNLDEHNRIATTDGRLLRRMVRDARTRGTDAESTIKMWPSVRAGEENYIFPHQESADVMFNSALIYELAVLKIYAEPLLFGIPQDSPQYTEAKRLLKFLEYFVPLAPEQIPMNSLVREFIGGGCFDV